MEYKIFALILLLAINLDFSIAKEQVVFSAIKKELQRSMTELQQENAPPLYYVSYSVVERKNSTVSAAFGKIKSAKAEQSRALDIDLRVGDHKFDNTHIIRGDQFQFSGFKSTFDLPIEDDEKSIRNAVWFITDKAYKNAIERYEKAYSNRAVKVQEEDTSADFSKEVPARFSNEIKEFDIDTAAWKAKARLASSFFANEDWLYDGSVIISGTTTIKYFINSDGSEIKQFEPSFRIIISAFTKAEDGMTLPLTNSYFAFSPNELPSDEQLEKDVKKMISLLKELREAELMKTFSGPAILSGEASGVFFHEIFGHRVEGHRQKDPSSSQTFKNFIEKKVLPEYIDVVFDPTINSLKGFPLSGHYVYDDEGVRGQKVVTVENGIFKNFIMSRSAIENFPNSNGHGRKNVGYDAVSRQSNLIVISKETLPASSLKDRLREECKKQDKEYGLYFEKVQGGFTFTGTTVPNAFNVTPILVYKIYADGRKDEMVRGVDLIGTPLTTFANIVAAGDDLGVFNGMCGAESGYIPVSACSPSLLVSLIEVQRKAKSQAKPPILEAPSVLKSN